MDADGLSIGPFAESHDSLVIGQWISTIDKIATKPKGKGKATQEQRNVRSALGAACWARLVHPDGTFGALDSERMNWARNTWERRLHPYSDKNFVTNGREKTPDSKAHWFNRFCKGLSVQEVTDPSVAGDVAQSIEEHLTKDAFRRGGGTRRSPKASASRAGLIAVRADSITKNALRFPGADIAEQREHGWTEEDIARYVAKSDPVAQIYKAVLDAEPDGQRVRWSIAAERLYAHYARVFTAPDIVLDRKDADKILRGVLALHEALRQLYRHRLKRHRRKPVHVTVLLPRDIRDALTMISRQQDNSDLNALVRLGKVIHHEAADQAGVESVAKIIGNWPEDVSRSYYWTSDGQTEIKRTEAFVRAWRGPIAHAQRTLADWVDPDRLSVKSDSAEAKPPDMLGAKFDDALAQLDDDAAITKARLLFGTRSDALGGPDPKAVLRLTKRALSKLRNAAFHFKGMGGFVQDMTLKILPSGSEDCEVLERVHALWHADQKDRMIRVKDALVGAHAEVYLNQPQMNQLWELLGAQESKIALPRFNRVIARAAHAWTSKEDRLALPDSASSKDLEAQPARRCQYVLIKMVYERGFRTWLTSRSADDLNIWIKQATDHTTEAAKEFHKHQVSKEELAQISARSAGLVKLEPGEGFAKFLFKMTALTTTEFRVQKGYTHDAGRAREQASFLDDLHCDLVALAFDTYLKDKKLGWLYRLRQDESPGNPQSSAADLPLGSVASAQDWQAVLYLVLHLIPVDDVGRLLHRWRWWSNKYDDEHLPAEGLQLAEAFTLYLDMHDAKFDGAEAITGSAAFHDLFDSDTTRKQVFPDALAAEAEGPRQIMQRGLREMLRFGDMASFAPVFAGRKVTAEQVKEWQNLDAQVAAAHETRKKVHEDYKRGLRPSTENERLLEQKYDLAAYVKAVKTITRHKRLSHHVKLTNHVRLHQIVMRVLGRLVDYAGLWERDVYFVLLALICLRGQTPRDVFQNAYGRKALRGGQIRKAVQNLEPEYKTALERHFGTGAFEEGGVVTIRNDLAHLNMMGRAARSDDARVPLDLTCQIDRTRRLMSYDRKLQNSVSKSVTDLMEREKIRLSFRLDKGKLTQATVKADLIKHFKRKELTENLHDPLFHGMVADVYGGTVGQLQNDLTDAQDIAAVVNQTFAAVKAEQDARRRPRNNRAQSQNPGGGTRRNGGKEKYGKHPKGKRTDRH